MYYCSLEFKQILSKPACLYLWAQQKRISHSRQLAEELDNRGTFDTFACCSITWTINLIWRPYGGFRIYCLRMESFYISLTIVSHKITFSIIIFRFSTFFLNTFISIHREYHSIFLPTRFKILKVKSQVKVFISVSISSSSLVVFYACNLLILLLLFF